MTTLQKCAIALLMLAFFAAPISAREYDKINIDRYKSDSLKPEDLMFTKEFATDQDRVNFKKLRTFYDARLLEVQAIETALDEEYYNLEPEIDLMQQVVDVLEEKSKGQDKDLVVVDLGSQVTFNWYVNLWVGKLDEELFDSTKVTVSTVKRNLVRMTKLLEETKETDAERNCLIYNESVLRSEIANCIALIDEALTPEYLEQEYRKNITMYFALMIGVLLAGFFLIIYKRSDATIANMLLGSSGLQFLTLFVLIISLILFGILKIIGGSELAAILSGISGYVLGKGIKEQVAGAPSVVKEIKEQNKAAVAQEEVKKEEEKKDESN